MVHRSGLALGARLPSIRNAAGFANFRPRRPVAGACQAQWPPCPTPPRAASRRRRVPGLAAVGPLDGVRRAWVVVLLLVARPGRRRSWWSASSFPQTDGDLSLPGLDGDGQGAARRPRHPAGLRRRPATTCSTRRGSCRPRTGSSRWTSAGTRPPAGSRSCSARPPSRPTRRSGPWAGAGSRSRSCPGSARRRRPTCRPTATA